MNSFIISGNIIDIANESIFPASIVIEDGRIASIVSQKGKSFNNYILPGFIDSHVHIESSMLVPSEFARLAVAHGTVASVSDPHEIANVLGIEGIWFMIANGENVPFKFYFGAPSCVPATTFETAGSAITTDDIRRLINNHKIKYLSEMMNYPGVIYQSADVLEKLKIAIDCGKPIDGHAPGLRGDLLKKYISAGIQHDNNESIITTNPCITTDHETFELEEASEKLGLGMKILIREGSAAKNFDALFTVIDNWPKMVMFCSDDKHPDDLVEGHINKLVSKAVKSGCNLFNVLNAACINPVLHYNLDVGTLKTGDSADFIVVDNLSEFNIIATYINGEKVAENGKSLIPKITITFVNKFNANSKLQEEYRIESKGKKIKVIEVIENQLITESIIADEYVSNGNIISNIDNDILKLTVINRYEDAKPAVAFVKGFGLKKGAIASSVAHDSHNIIAVGTSDDEICSAVNAIIESKGGMAVACGREIDILPLPIAGLMSMDDGYTVAENYSNLNKKAKLLGSHLQAPFMTLSFMALLVIPKLKLSDQGLFDGEKFEFTDIHV